MAEIDIVGSTSQTIELVETANETVVFPANVETSVSLDVGSNADAELVEETSQDIELGRTGPAGADGAPGAKGDQGDPGQGIAAGGTTGQGLAKASDDDYDTTWADFLVAADVDGFYRSNYQQVITEDTNITRGGSYLVFSPASDPLDPIVVTLPDPGDFAGEEIFILNTPFGWTQVSGSIDGGSGSLLPPNTYVAFRSVLLPPDFGGVWLWGSAQRAGVPYDLPDWYDGAGGSTIAEGKIIQMIETSGITRPQWVDPLIPAGGNVGQLPVKQSGDDYDVEWEDLITCKQSDLYGYQATSEDATYEYIFKEDKDENWVVIRINKTTDVAHYWKGTGGYASVYVDENSAPSGTPVWASYGDTF